MKFLKLFLKILGVLLAGLVLFWIYLECTLFTINDETRAFAEREGINLNAPNIEKILQEKLQALSPKEIDLLQQKADLGDAESQYKLGVLYDDGIGVEQDYYRARHYFELAVEQEHVAAHYRLAVMYVYARWVVQDFERAMKYFKIAAEGGDIRAHYVLGVAYHFGEITTKNSQRALFHYQKAVHHGYALAMVNLAGLFMAKENTFQNMQVAEYYLRLAIQSEFFRSRLLLLLLKLYPVFHNN